MTTTRRHLFTQAALLAGAITSSAALGTAAVAQEACDPGLCDPFPVLGERRQLSRDEFNAIANNIVQGVIESAREIEGLDVSDSNIEQMREATLRSLEATLSKYYEIN